MNALIEKEITTRYGKKSLSVHAMDITVLDEPIDVMTVSAFYRSYHPTTGTMIRALELKNISVSQLSMVPEIDLRNLCNIWLSKEIPDPSLPIRRIGCIETNPYIHEASESIGKEGLILSSIQSYFSMLNIASLSGIQTETIGLPILGAGRQHISMDLVTIPMISECVKFLKSNEHTSRIRVITYNQEQAFRFASALEKSYSVYTEDLEMQQKCSENTAFISYSSKDKRVADALCAKLEARGIKVWYAPRDIHSADYASSIVEAIQKCTHFIVILSRNSLHSNHVLNEIDLAFRELNRNIKLLPLRIDETEIGSSFLYYLSRQNWIDAYTRPLEARLTEFADGIVKD